MTLIILIIILITSLLMMGNSGWHLNRNKHNKLPVGELKNTKDDFYEDEAGLIWELQPAIKNKFHQPDHEIKKPENPYLGLKLSEAFDPKNPNLKFLSRTESGGSYEAILQPNGRYLTEGIKQGTYNYGHPSGFFGYIKHVFLDVIPHFVNSNYKN